MSNRRLAMMAVLAPAVLVAMAGCAEGPPSSSTSTEAATIKGTVTIKGKKASAGTITFDPANRERPMAVAGSGEIGKDGTYSVKSLVGENAVRIVLPGKQADRDLGSIELSYDVKPGENQHDIVFPPPGN